MWWDAVAGIYDLATQIVNGRANRKVALRVSQEIQSTDQVLECACGTGLLTQYIYPICRSIVATDYSAAMLKQVNRKCSNAQNLQLERCDITQLPYPDHSFDVVIAGNVLHLLSDPIKALRELERVCRPGGKIIIPTYVQAEQKKGITKYWIKALKLLGIKFTNAFTYHSYQEFFKCAGYEKARYELIKGRPPCAIATLVQE